MNNNYNRKNNNDKSFNNDDDNNNNNNNNDNNNNDSRRAENTGFMFWVSEQRLVNQANTIRRNSWMTELAIEEL